MREKYPKSPLLITFVHFCSKLLRAPFKIAARRRKSFSDNDLQAPGGRRRE